MSKPSISNQLHVIVKFFYPVAAGIETNILETHTTLRDRGWKITIHTTRDTHIEKNVLKLKEKVKDLSVIRYVWNWWGYWPAIKNQENTVIALHNFNIFPHFTIMMWACFLKLTRQKKFVLLLTPHGGFNPEWSTFGMMSRLIKSWYHYTIGVWLINAAVDGVRAVSAWEAQEMKNKGIKPKKITIISNGIENLAFTSFDKKVPADFKRKVDELGPYILQMGRIHEIKNFETTIKALALIHSKLTFVIAGPISDRAYKNKLDSLIKELELQDRVIFWGVVRDESKFYLIKKAQMMVHMAKWESYCNIVHEGMSQGLVCLVANNTALPLLIKNGRNGFCLETYDYQTLAKKINWVLKNKRQPKVKKIEKLNKEMVASHSWKRVAITMHTWYQSLLQAHHESI